MTARLQSAMLLARSYRTGLRSLPSQLSVPTLVPPSIRPAIRRYVSPSTQASYNRLDALSQPIEEELVRNYRAEDYYPANIGQVLQNRYKIVGKLGYGSASTVWLCRDLSQGKEFVALKIYINRSRFQRELPIYQHLTAIDANHGGRLYIRRLLNHFILRGPQGEHTCLVLEASGMNMEELKELIPEPGFEPNLLRQLLRDVLRALSFLHEHARVIHTDVQPKNILLGITDDSAFVRFEQDEQDHPFPRKQYSTHTVYVSRPMRLTQGLPLLSDFSEARFADQENTDLIMPDVHRAPEVVLSMPWSCSVDLWGFAMTLWDLFEPNRIFSPRGGDGKYCEATHIAQMIALMGPPPPVLLQDTPKRDLYWDAEGKWRGICPIPDITLETLERRLHGHDQRLFLTFIRKMLQWCPAQRAATVDIYMDEWLLADLIESGVVVRED